MLVHAERQISHPAECQSRILAVPAGLFDQGRDRLVQSVQTGIRMRPAIGERGLVQSDQVAMDRRPR